ncbi:SA1362 family protein [Halobacillus sp. K22]|uniref:SA1362 family protein n=1 Tax=Halobacillus sp. K22 TaxID=3457431 RepID=UPI003FCEB723
MRNWMTPIIYTLVALAVFFVGYQLLTDTSSFLSSIAMMIGIAAVVYGAIYFFFLRNRGISGGRSSNEMKKYKQAVKQSKQKYKQPAPVVKKSQAARTVKPTTIHKKNKRRGSGPQLRVIEGNKNKDKNRASF